MWIGFLVEVLEMVTTAFFSVYVDFISYLILRNFALLYKEGNGVWFLDFE